MARLRAFSWWFSAATAALWVLGCSFQNFDYLKGEYRSGAGGTSGAAGSLSAATGGVGGSVVAMSGSGGTGNSAGSNPSGGSTTVGGDSSVGQAGEAGAPSVAPGVLLNGGFEVGSMVGSATSLTDWTNVGDVAAATQACGDAYKGSCRLSHWLMLAAYNVTTSQTVQPLPDGKYTFSIWVRHSMYLVSEYAFAKGYSKSQPAAQMKADTMATANEMTFTQIVLSHIPVTSGSCEVGIHTEGNDTVDNWSVIDEAEFTLESAQ
jgi:hypothetical protein